MTKLQWCQVPQWLTTMAHQIVGRRSPYGLPVSFMFAAVKNEPQMKVAQFQVENCDSGTKLDKSA